MLIIWKGFGFVVAIIGFAVLLLTELVIEYITGNENFYQENLWSVSIGLFIAAIITYGFCRLLKKSSTEHSLFFIPVEWWPLTFASIGLVFLILDIAKIL